MQPTSAKYKRIMSDPEHSFESSLVVGYRGDLITEKGERILFGGEPIDIGVSNAEAGYREDILMSIVTSNNLFKDNNPIVGCCVSAEIDIEMLKPAAEFRRMSELLPYVRATSKTEESEWIPKGVYYIDTRETTHNLDGLDILTIHGYDSMIKAEQFYPEPPDQKINWSVFEIGTDEEKSTTASFTFTKSQYPQIIAHFEDLVNQTLQYNAETEGMQRGDRAVGDVEFYNGNSLIKRISVGDTFSVTNSMLNTTKIVIYGSTDGAHVWNYSFYNVNDTISALSMVNTIVSALNENIDGDIGSGDIRRLHLLEEDAYKLRHPSLSDRPAHGESGYWTDNGYRFNYIASTYTCREVLSMIASAYCGNWWIDDNNNLRLAVLMEYPEESYRLSDEVGYQLLIGGEYIYVG